MNKELGKKVYESKLVVNCETYEELIKYLDFLSRKGCKSVLGPIDEIKETTILDLWNKLFKSICVRIDKGIIKYIHFNNIRFYKNLMGEDSVITYKELMQEEINVENAVFKDLKKVLVKQEINCKNKIKEELKDFGSLENSFKEINKIKNKINYDNILNKKEIPQATKASYALKSIINKLSSDDTEEFKKIDDAINETNKMIESDEYKEFIDKIKKESEYIPFGFCNNLNGKQDEVNKITIKPNIKFLDLEPQFGTSGNLDTQSCKCNIEYINHPIHYNNGIEAIEYIESHNFNFNLGNAVKYITRCEYKGNKKEDIEKAIWYLQREIDKL